MTHDPIMSSRIAGIEANASKAQSATNARLANYAISQDEQSDEMPNVDRWTAPIRQSARNLEDRIRKKESTSTTVNEAEEDQDLDVMGIEAVSGIAAEYEEKNPELLQATLLALRARLTKGDSKEDVLRKAREVYSDLSLADEALDFLIETADPNTKQAIAQAKEEINSQFGQEIRAGRNMGTLAREFSKTLGSPTALRDLYRSIVANPRDANTLFNELTNAYPFEKMKVVIEFITHSLGADLKAKGPSITRAELTRLVGESRTLQAILGVFHFFQDRMGMIHNLFERGSLPLPKQITFDALAKLFMKFIQERYPSIDKAQQLAQQLGISQSLAAKLIIYLQFRDAMRNVATQLFKDERQRQELLTCFIDVLEGLDDELEAIEVKREEEEKKQKKKKKKNG